MCKFILIKFTGSITLDYQLRLPLNGFSVFVVLSILINEEIYQTKILK